MRRKLVRVGNSLGVTLPPAAVTSLGVAEGEAVDVEVEEGRVVITGRRYIRSVLGEWTPIACELEPSMLDRAIRQDRSAR